MTKEFNGGNFKFKLCRERWYHKLFKKKKEINSCPLFKCQVEIGINKKGKLIILEDNEITISDGMTCNIN